VRTIKCVVVNQCYSHQPNNLKPTDSKLYFTKLLLFVMRFTLQVRSTTVTYFYSSENFLNSHSNHLISKSIEPMCPKRRCYGLCIHLPFMRITTKKLMIIWS